MNSDLWLRVLTTALFDWSLALCCGCLLTAYWLRAANGRACALPARPPGVRAPSLLMALSLCCQMWLLARGLIGRTGMSELIASLPSIAGTHAGKVTLSTLFVVCLLWIASILRRASVAFPASLTCLILALHAAIGHAAAEGDFTWAELLQFLHLSAMAAWTGGVVAVALFFVPHLAGAALAQAKEVFGRLSAVSTGSVVLVLLTGAIKGYAGLEGHVTKVTASSWGRVLLLKLCLVGVALGLGLIHRRWVNDPERPWAVRQVFTLRLEAVCLSLVVLVSAWLSNMEPPE